jgi:adhesin transport system outer membrane protein
MDSAVAQHQAAMDDLQNQQLALEEQITKEQSLVQAAQLRRKGLEAAIQGTADVADSYERQFLAGRKQWLDLLNSARELSQSEVQLADVIGAQHLSAWKLAIFTRGTEVVFDSVSDLNPGRNNGKAKP